MGRLEDARREFESFAASDFSTVGPPQGWLPAIAGLAETCAVIGDVARAVPLYELLQPYAGRAVVVGHGLRCFGPADRFLGQLAALRGEWETAERHFAAALALSHRLASPPFIALTQQDLAAMLITRDWPADRARVTGVLSAAFQTAERLGMRAVVEQVTRMRAQLDAPVPAPVAGRAEDGVNERTRLAQPAALAIDQPTAPADPPTALFRKEGAYWTIAFDGSTVRLKDSKGLHHLAYLLCHPRLEFHALDLLQSGGLGSQRHRELNAAAGSDRQADAPAERARLVVTQRVKAIVKKIRDHHPVLGRHLGTSLKTGYFCAYLPDPRVPVEWLVSS